MCRDELNQGHVFMMLTPRRTTSWCPDSCATHHVCREATAFHESTPYSSTSPLLMVDGTPTKISCVGNSNLPTMRYPDSGNFAMGPHS
ncbi:hypothetical protein V6Z11_D01G088400 [Gossypium hirsutum]